MKNQIQVWQLDIIKKVYFLCHGLQEVINSDPKSLIELVQQTKFSLILLEENYQIIKELPLIESQAIQKRKSK